MTLQDLILTSPERGGWAEIATMLKIDGVGESDHLPVAISLRSKEQAGCKAEKVFIPVQLRLKDKRLRQIKDVYAKSLPIISEEFSEVGSISAFHTVCDEWARVVRQPCMT